MTSFSIYSFFYLFDYFLFHYYNFHFRFLGPFGEFADYVPSTSLLDFENSTMKAHQKEDNTMNINRLWVEFQSLAQQNLLSPESASLAPLECLYPPLPYGSTEKPPMQNLIQDLDSMYTGIPPPGGIPSTAQDKSSSSTMSGKSKTIKYLRIFFLELILFFIQIYLIFLFRSFFFISLRS